MEFGEAETGAEVARLRERLLLDPRDIAAIRNLARLLEHAGDLAGAVDLRQRALRVDPYDVDSILDLGRLWSALADPARAESWYRRALVIDMDNPAAWAGLRALEHAGGLSHDYIRILFDQYADRFDAELLGALCYRAPELVASLLTRRGLPPGGAGILDLGCGTGLSGLALKPFARTLDGVDLSSAMIAKARARAIYRHLAVGDAAAFLASSEESWDVIAAVDMLNYVGDVTPIFTLACARLGPGGLLAGTVEKRAEGGSDLSEKRRYRHGLDALSAALAAAGLRPLEMVEDTLRTEGGEAVVGIVFVADRTRDVPNQRRGRLSAAA